MQRIYIIFIAIIACIIALFVGKFLLEEDYGKKKSAATADLVSLNGLIRSEDKDGNLISEISYKNNIKHGPYKIFYVNGQVQEEGSNKDGKNDGVITFYNRDSAFNYSQTFKDGVMHGLSKTFVSSIGMEGNEDYMLETTYVNGLQHGVSKATYMNGNIKSDQTYVNGKKEGEAINYFINGQISSISNYVDDKLEGVGKEYYGDGTLRGTKMFKRGNMNGELINYYPNGGKKNISNYKDDVVHGKVKFFYKEGQLKVELTYINGKREGVVKVYYQNGQLKKEIFYKNDKIDGVAKDYYENDNLKYK